MCASAACVCAVDPLIENHEGLSAYDYSEVDPAMRSYYRDEAGVRSSKVKGCGLWPVISFINHARDPNTSRRFIGKLMFIRAARDLPRDTEITVSYHTDPAFLKKKWGIVS